MKWHGCSRVGEVTTALREERGLEGCAPELQTHVAACPQCSELVLVARALRRAREEAIPRAQPAPPDLLWWRAQLRRRNALAERAARPIGLVEKLALGIMLLWIAAWAAAQREAIADALQWWARSPHYSLFRGNINWFTGDGPSWLPAGILAATLGLLAGLATYLGWRGAGTKRQQD